MCTVSIMLWTLWLLLQEIDGDALLLLKSDMIMKYLGLKLGPALKLCYHIDKLKQNKFWPVSAPFKHTHTHTQTQMDSLTVFTLTLICCSTGHFFVPHSLAIQGHAPEHFFLLVWFVCLYIGTFHWPEHFLVLGNFKCTSVLLITWYLNTALIKRQVISAAFWDLSFLSSSESADEFYL